MVLSYEIDLYNIYVIIYEIVKYVKSYDFHKKGVVLYGYK